MLSLLSKVGSYFSPTEGITKINIVLVIGPSHSGKSYIADICQSLLNDRDACQPSYALHVDGNVLGHSPSLVAIMGDHRNEYTQAKIIKTILEGKTPIVSMSGGALSEKGEYFLFENYLRTVFGKDSLITATFLLPKEYPQEDAPLLVLDGEEIKRFQFDSSQYDELSKLYYCKEGIEGLEKEHKKDMAAWRIFQNIIISFSSVAKIIFFPFRKLLSEIQKESLSCALQNIKPPRIEHPPCFTQKRFLTLDKRDDSGKIHHITLDYHLKGVTYTPPSSDPQQHHVGQKVIGKLMTCLTTEFVIRLRRIATAVSIIKDDETLRGMILSPFPAEKIDESLDKLLKLSSEMSANFACLHDETVKELNTQIGKTLKIWIDTSKRAKVSNELTSILEELDREKCLKFELKGQIIQFIVFNGIFDGELGTRAHITVNYGRHKPADMRTAAQYVYRGESVFPIDSVRYEFNTGRDVEVDIMDIYYI